MEKSCFHLISSLNEHVLAVSGNRVCKSGNLHYVLTRYSTVQSSGHRLLPHVPHVPRRICHLPVLCFELTGGMAQVWAQQSNNS